MSGNRQKSIEASEWDVRVNLAACYRLMARYGMTDLIYNHITARVPGRDDAFLIAPYGYLYEEVTASSLCKVNLAGDMLALPFPDAEVNIGGYIIHSAVHAARPDARCVIHTHTRAATAVSAMKRGLLPISQTAMWFHGRIAYHDFEGPAINRDERARIIADLGSFNIMLLRNHGSLTVGRSIAEAFMLTYLFEMACKTQVDACSADEDLVFPGDEIAKRTADAFHDHNRQAGAAGEKEWRALMRLLDREGSDHAS